MRLNIFIYISSPKVKPPRLPLVQEVQLTTALERFTQINQGCNELSHKVGKRSDWDGAKRVVVLRWQEQQQLELNFKQSYILGFPH